jgi:hypothetical protein
MDAETADHVIGRRDHAAAFGRAADDQRLADQFRPVPLFDRGIECVHVDVEYHSALIVDNAMMVDNGRASEYL